MLADKLKKNDGDNPLTALGLKENYCSNPDGETMPYCYTDTGIIEFCDIPRYSASTSILSYFIIRNFYVI